MFRGQTFDWARLIPSLFRLTEEKRKFAYEELRLFSEWANGVPQMRNYHGNDDAITAIAQHYGIATSFLDVTTDPRVALAFAKSERAASDDDAVIYCFLEGALRHIEGIKIVKISVENLWRLEVQSGLFLDYITDSIVDAVKSMAIKIHFPRALRSAAETRRLYPLRKSALESVLDQWFYKRQIEGALDQFVPHVKNQVVVRRQTYPGIFRWREIPELTPEWLSKDLRWVQPPIESVRITGRPLDLKIRLQVSDPLRDAKNLRELILPAICEAFAAGRLLSFDFELSGVGKRYSKRISQIANWVWDGIRVLPYKISELASAMANMLTILSHVSKRTKHSSNLAQILFGETDIIEVAPVGGHIEAGFVSKSDLDVARNYAGGRGFTKYSLKMLTESPDILNDFITDPWLLFDFLKFKRIFIEQFVPTAIIGFWENWVDDKDEISKLRWSVPFNPALLGYVSRFQYRFSSPLAAERDVSRLVLINNDMDKDDISESFLFCMPHIMGGGGPFLLKLHGYGHDARPIWEIPDAVQRAVWIFDIGGISVLEVSSSLNSASTDDEIHADGLGAFEVWLIAKGLMEEVNGKSLGEIRPIYESFWRDLSVSNKKMEKYYKEALGREMGR